ADVASAGDRIVKRLVPGAGTSYPAGFARLTDARHLLVVIDENKLNVQQDDRTAGDQVAASESAPAISEDQSAEAEPAREAQPPAATVGEKADTIPVAADGARPIEKTAATVDHGPDAAEAAKQPAD
ncbi:hypothetical protein EN844_31510, partial [Mesorhizobium sp. M3A.F.Ca.ET.201.01.1.1]